MACERLSKSSAKALLDEADTFIIGCNGVLWDARDVIPGSLETLAKLKNLGKKILFITNDSSKSRQDLLEKLQQHGFPNMAQLDDIMCTAYFAAKYLRHNVQFKDKVFLVGCHAMGAELDAAGVRHTGIGAYPFEGSIKEWTTMTFDPDVKCVLVGYDPEISYMKSMHAATYLQRPDCLFLATNGDTHIPLNNSNVRIPDAGTMLRTVSLPSQREPTILGKPERYMFDLLQETHSLDPTRTVIVGDSLEMDVGMAKRCGLKSLLVLTGATADSEVPVQDAQPGEPNNTTSPSLVPDLYTSRLADLDSYC